MSVSASGTGDITFGGSGSIPGGHIYFDGQGDVDLTPALDVYAPPEWSWVLLDSTGAPLSGLTSATTRKLTFQLDGAASASFTMPGEHPETPYVVELSTDVYVSRNGRAMFRGRVGGSTETYSATDDHVDFTAIDYRGMLDHRIFWPSAHLVFTNTDQSDIAFTAINDSQALPGGNLGIRRGAGAVTGIRRDRTFTAGSGIGQAIAEMGDDINGFDWEVDPSLHFNLYCPQRGTNRGTVLAYGRDIVACTATLNVDTFANAVYYTGSTPQTRPIGTTVTSFGTTGRWETQKSDPSVTLQSTVNEHAAGELAADSQRVEAFSVTLAPDVWNPYLLWLGDTVRLIVQTGRLNVDVTRRIVQIDVTLDDNGVEQVVFAIGQAPRRLSDRLATLSDRLSALELAPGIGNFDNTSGVGGSGTTPGITQITSADSSVTVGSPLGPTTDLHVSAVTQITSVDSSVTITNPLGPVVDLHVAGGGGGAAYASLTGTGQTTTPGFLTQAGGFFVDAGSSRFLARTTGSAGASYILLSTLLGGIQLLASVNESSYPSPGTDKADIVADNGVQIVYNNVTTTSPTAPSMGLRITRSIADGIGVGAGIYVESGNPNTSGLTPNSKGDVCIDTGTPRIWQWSGSVWA